MDLEQMWKTKNMRINWPAVHLWFPHPGSAVCSMAQVANLLKFAGHS